MKRKDLELEGFVGWIPLLKVQACSAVPAMPGIYAVTYDQGRPASWPGASCGGWHKGRNPAVLAPRLDQEWVDDTDIVYLGKTDRTLAKRLGEFARFGRGEAVAHWGGRLLWQLPQVDRLTVGWRALEAGLATSEEKALLGRFAEVFDRLPFANLRR